MVSGEAIHSDHDDEAGDSVSSDDDPVFDVVESTFDNLRVGDFASEHGDRRGDGAHFGMCVVLRSAQRGVNAPFFSVPDSSSLMRMLNVSKIS